MINATKSPADLASERLERIKAAVNLKEPDRVPLELNLEFGFRARWYGISPYEFFFNYDKAREAIIKTAVDFPTDFPPFASIGTGSLLGLALREYRDISIFVGTLTGPMHDILRDKYTRWPGRELSPNVGTFQFIGGEFLKPEEYEKFADDPTKFMSEVVVPRAHQSLERPGSAESMAALARVVLEGVKYANFLESLIKDLLNLGYPMIVGDVALVPIDFIGDFLRTIPGVLLDLRRWPDKVKLACDTLMEETIYRRSLTPGTGFLFIPLHLNEFLPPRLFYEFYWPYLKEIIIRAHNQGIKCWVGFEGRHDAYLESILELPKGWGIALFEKTDVRKAKRVLEGHTCVMGGIPASLFVTGTPEKIEKYVKELLQEVMPGGGFILASCPPVPTEAPPENVKAVIRAVNKYGISRR